MQTFSPESAAAYGALESGLAKLETAELACVRLVGEDALSWLQGQVTNDLRALEPGGRLSCCLTSPTGQCLAAMDVWALGDGLSITLPLAALPSLEDRVREMVILEDVVLDDLAGASRLLCIQGAQADAWLSSRLELPSSEAGQAECEGVRIGLFHSRRTRYGGWDLWVPSHANALIEKFETELPSVSAEAYEPARLEAGIPLLGRDYTERTLPPELGPDFEARHISYTKGCYTGQEVLMRIYSRGHTNRTWRGILSESPLRIGAKISHPTREDAGDITSAAYSPSLGWIGAAMLRNEAAADGERVEVEGVPATVRAMPLRP